MSTSFNLEDEYGGFLDALEKHISEISDDEIIEHFGVKGMKWGVRKDRSSNREPLKSLGPDRVSRKTASGETITLVKDKPTALHKLFGKLSKTYREDYKNGATLTILDSSGKKIGNAEVAKKNNDELYLSWLGIKKSARGNGYATAVMKAGEEFGRQEGFKKMTLEVPGNAPDARHIYEKLGFKVTKEADSSDDYWGGLTEMEYVFGEAKHAIESYFEKPSLDELVHFGVKGMKWGVRKQREPVTLAKGYTSRQHSYDRTAFGRRPAERINERLKSGMSLNKAREIERKRLSRIRTTTGLVALGAYLAIRLGPYLKVVAQAIATDAVNNKRAANGARAAAAMFSDSRGIPNYSTISATFNSTTGIWE